jgi:hypothetical protein
MLIQNFNQEGIAVDEKNIADLRFTRRRRRPGLLRQYYQP